jgi:hypothetical protein
MNQSQSHITADSQSASPSWCQTPIWDPFSLWLFLNSCGFVGLVRPLWREDGSVMCSSMTQVQFQVTVVPWIASNLVCECFARRAQIFNKFYLDKRAMSCNTSTVLPIRFVYRALRDHKPLRIVGNRLACSILEYRIRVVVIRANVVIMSVCVKHFLFCVQV